MEVGYVLGVKQEPRAYLVNVPKLCYTDFFWLINCSAIKLIAVMIGCCINTLLCLMPDIYSSSGEHWCSMGYCLNIFSNKTLKVLCFHYSLRFLLSYNSPDKVKIVICKTKVFIHQCP